MADIICAGFGGQGVLTAGLSLAKTGMNNGKNVSWIPSYGSEMRGGTANCNVRISDGKVPSPFIKHSDILLAMNIPSVSKFMPLMRTGGLLVVNTTLVKDIAYREDIEVLGIPATDIAEAEHNLRGANIVMLGAFASAGRLFDKPVLAAGIDEFFASKGRSNPKNALCFERGYAECQRL